MMMRSMIVCTGVAFLSLAGSSYAQIPLDNVQEEQGNSAPSGSASVVAGLTQRIQQNAMKSDHVEQALADAKDVSASVVQREDSMLHPWKDALSFELSLNKLRSFIIAGRAIKRINREWDILIAAAAEDELAAEYQKQLVEETSQAIHDIPGLSLDEYEALYLLSLKDGSFAALLRALQKQIYDNE